MEHGKANAFDPEFIAWLRAELAEANGPLVLTGRAHIFSAGVDLKWSLQADDDAIRSFLGELSALFFDLFHHPHPVVAAINGHALAGGCVLAMACDHRVGAPGDWSIGVPELGVGVPFPPIALEIVRFAQPGPALQKLVLFGQPLKAPEAVTQGLVDEQADDWEATAVKRAETLAAIPRDAFARTKLALRAPALERAQTGDLAAVQDAWCSDAVRGAIRSYVERTLG